MKTFKEFVENNQEFVLSVRESAYELHNGVNQLYDDKPYVYHLNMACEELVKMEPMQYIDQIKVAHGNILSDLVYEALVFAVYYHDSIEDARLTYNDVYKIAMKFLENAITAHIATEIVYACTNEKGRNRAERASERYYAGIRETFLARYVKLADRLANTRYSHETGSRMTKVYENEREHFEKSIGVDVSMSEYLNEWFKNLG